MIPRIQVVALLQKGSKKVKVVLQKLSAEQKAVVDALRLTRFVPN